MTNEQLIELVKFCPEFTEEQKALYESLLVRNLPVKEAAMAKKLILELIKEKMNLSILNQYLEESENLKSLIEKSLREDEESRENQVENPEEDLEVLKAIFLIKSHRIKDIVENAKGRYNDVIKKAEQQKIEDIKTQNGLG